jgi:hypothetical protein
MFEDWLDRLFSYVSGVYKEVTALLFSCRRLSDNLQFRYTLQQGICYITVERCFCVELATITD